MNLLLEILRHTYGVLAEAAPFILFGTAMAGLLRVFLPADRLPSWLTGKSFGSAVRASLIGLPLPLCSCSVLPVAMELRKRGASRPATSSFLISTPQTGVDSIILSWVLLNPVFAIARVLGSLVTALVTGGAETLFGGEDKPMQETAKPVASCCSSKSTVEQMSASCCGTTPQAPPTRPALKERLFAGQIYAFSDLLPKMSKYYVIGLVATGVVMALMPEGLLEEYVGGGIGGMLLVAVMGVALYICASAATPLAAVLVAKGMSPGTALVMLLAGPAASLASLAAVRAMIGLRGLGIYLTSITVCAIALGLGLDAFYGISGIAVVVQQAARAHEHITLLAHAAAVVMIAVFAFQGVRTLRARLSAPPAPPSGHQRIQAEALQE
ncbi:MAG: uncharacterized protein PWP23_272 [Candidatus Sumerlaeota bacterium]|nr:uncharacterized protein [Candidatus Sumerlaeota bacterium]